MIESPENPRFVAGDAGRRAVRSVGSAGESEVIRWKFL
ncbi:MAG: hypothetical protein JWL72_3761 [Ilumatobacteraceae bacterium]|nr:hypothetical protein [Ilumatobacteraceae bacterium]